MTRMVGLVRTVPKAFSMAAKGELEAKWGQP